MSPRIFQVLLIVCCITGIAGGALDLVFPELIPSGLSQAYDNEEFEPMGNIFVAMSLAAVLLVASIVGLVGLFLFKNWGRSISVISTVVGIFMYPFMNVVLTSGLSSMFTDVSMLMWGFLLAAAYYSPSLNEKFNRQVA